MSLLTTCVGPTRAFSVPSACASRSRRAIRSSKLLGADWNKTHWYGTAAERDAALIEMARKHEYSRPGDKPALKFDKVEKLHESRGL